MFLGTLGAKMTFSNMHYILFVGNLQLYTIICALILSETLALYKSFTYLLTYLLISEN